MPFGYQLKNIREDKRCVTLSVHAGALPRQRGSISCTRPQALICTLTVLPYIAGFSSVLKIKIRSDSCQKINIIISNFIRRYYFIQCPGTL
jgi:hypothetical protein